MNVHIQKVSNLLDQYIVLHDEVFAKKWWQVFTPIDFTGISIQADRVRGELSRVLSEIQKAPTKSDFDNFLERYVSALISTLNAFSRILMGLAQKARGREYSTKTYKADIGIYENLVEEYLRLGKKLNEFQG